MTTRYYLEKLASLNNLTSTTTRRRSHHYRRRHISPIADLPTALDRIAHLEEELKCEEDEKADLVGLKVSIENEVVELREVNDRLRFQVENLRTEKDKLHKALAALREMSNNDDARGGGVLFIAEGGAGGQGGVIKRFPGGGGDDEPPEPDDLSPPTPVNEGAVNEHDDSSQTIATKSVVISHSSGGVSPSHSRSPPMVSLARLSLQPLRRRSQNNLRSPCSTCGCHALGYNINTGDNSRNVIFEHDQGLEVSSAAIEEDEEEEVKVEVMEERHGAAGGGGGDDLHNEDNADHDDDDEEDAGFNEAVDEVKCA